MEQIDTLLEKISPLIKILKLREPDFIELAATGSILHSFYNGIESIFAMIEKHYGILQSDSATWHKELVKSMQSITNTRKQVISETTAERLLEYMMFRHFFRHAYGFQLDWNKMRHLADNMHPLWETLKSEINSFMYKSTSAP